jgi:hypothetical protein
MYICMPTSKRMHIYTNMYVCAKVYISSQMHKHFSVCLSLRQFSIKLLRIHTHNEHTDIYIYIYIYIYMYIHICMYTHVLT